MNTTNPTSGGGAPSRRAATPSISTTAPSTPAFTTPPSTIPQQPGVTITSLLNVTENTSNPAAHSSMSNARHPQQQQPGAEHTSESHANFQKRQRELSRKAAALPSNASAARTRSLADFLVPGMLNLSIADALAMLSELTYALQENQVLAQRVLNRLLFLRTEVENKAIGARIQSDVILRYGEQVGRSITFFRKHAAKTLIGRIAANRRFIDGVDELHARIDYFFTKVGLTNRQEMREWKASWETDLIRQQDWLTMLLSNKHVLLAQLNERSSEETLTELQYELTHHLQAQKTPKHAALMQSVIVELQNRYEMMFFPLVPMWFVSRDDVRFKQEPFAIGSYGALYRGVMERTGAKVVVKSMYSDSKQTQKALFHECSLWATLDHPNVLKMKGACYVGSPMFFLCEDAGDKRSLPEIMSAANSDKSTAMPTRQRTQMWRYLLQAASGLRYVHGCGIVHNNLKGSNIVIGADGQAKLCDFGFSRVLADPVNAAAATHTGSVRWKAPELLLGATPTDALPTHASDIYALAMTIVEVATGDRPWGRSVGDTDVLARVKVQHSYPRPNDIFTDEQWTLISAMSAYTPSARPSVQQVITAIEQILLVSDNRAPTTTKTCAKCSSQNPSANKFCNECGNKFP